GVRARASERLRPQHAGRSLTPTGPFGSWAAADGCQARRPYHTPDIVRQPAQRARCPPTRLAEVQSARWPSFSRNVRRRQFQQSLIGGRTIRPSNPLPTFEPGRASKFPVPPIRTPLGPVGGGNRKKK